MDLLFSLALKFLPKRFSSSNVPYSKLAILHIAQLLILMLLGLALITMKSPKTTDIYNVKGVIDSVAIQKRSMIEYERSEDVFIARIWVTNHAQQIKYESYRQADSVQHYLKPGTKFIASCISHDKPIEVCDAIEIKLQDKIIGGTERYFKSRKIAQGIGLVIFSIAVIAMWFVIKGRDRSKYQQAIADR